MQEAVVYYRTSPGNRDLHLPPTTPVKKKTTAAAVNAIEDFDGIHKRRKYKKSMVGELAASRENFCDMSVFENRELSILYWILSTHYS